MPRLSVEARCRVISLHQQGWTPKRIWDQLQREAVTPVTLSITVYYLLSKYQRHKTIVDLPRRRRPEIINDQMKTFIEETLQEDDETTAVKLKHMLAARWPQHPVSVSTIKRLRKKLGWVCTCPKYCQMIREVSLLPHTVICTDVLNN